MMHRTTAMATLTLATVLSACLVTGDPTEPATDTPTLEPVEVSTLTVDVTDREAFVYVDLDSGAVLGPDAADGTEWDLAFRNVEIRTNGGTSGTGTVAVGLAVDADDYYDASGAPILDAFVQADAEAELTHLVSPFTTPEVVSDTIVGVFAEDWLDYDITTGISTANFDDGWLVRSGEGTSFARVHMDDLDFPTRDGEGIKSFSVSVEVDAGGGFDSPIFFGGSVPGTGGEVCFDMDTNANVECTGTSWDLMLGFTGRDSFIYTNGGDIGDGMGAAFGPIEWTELQAYATATEAPDGTDVSGRYAVDETKSVFSEVPWFAYDLQGQSRWYPNFRVYAVQISDNGPLYAVQVTDYDDRETGGFVGLRWVEL